MIPGSYGCAAAAHRSPVCQRNQRRRLFDPVSGHHLKSVAYEEKDEPPSPGAFRVLAKRPVTDNMTLLGNR
jgi:hypothetical protein